MLKMESGETNLAEWLTSIHSKDTDVETVTKYFHLDEVKVKDLNLTLGKLDHRLRAAKEELKNAATKSKMAQIALDKCAEEFRQVYAARQEVVKQWEDAVDLLRNVSNVVCFEIQNIVFSSVVLYIQ
ncbi:coiled-coil domain-containing protein 39-like [Eurytemora carolleeae]|uniref:coiled-coil domain-containing protein 39-like n=1 Tax=Eurytemora carolleeae TaxID=1294199 RepID=UPI000C7945ED|nr:coiled-coil domain-containing protein 39-like [Eurytemora carolleeae]|eukprot:XP_023326939.1 coiled-coil domain-containing protein 39-like [Eurytemora affinis]